MGFHGRQPPTIRDQPLALRDIIESSAMDALQL